MTKSTGSRHSNVPRAHAKERGLSTFDGTFPGATIRLTAGEAGVAGSVVYQSDDLLALLASNDNEDSSEIIGIATQGFAAGRVVNIQYSGPLTIQSWSWTAGAKVYVGVDGALTQTEPVSGYVMPVGVAISPKTILIKIGGGGGGSGGASDAADLTYTPDDAGDWSPAPNDAAEALDQLAARAITSTINVDGASAEVYELTLSATQTDVTGDSTEYTIPFDTETTSRDWASNSSGSVTLQAGTYIVQGSVQCGGDGTGDESDTRIKVDGNAVVNSVLRFTNEADFTGEAITTITVTATSVISFSMDISGATKVYDAVSSGAKTFLRITRLPVQAPFSDVQEDSTTTRTLGLGDLGKWIEATNASGLEITVPPQSDVAWPLNAEIHGCGDSNAVTFVEGSGVTIKALSAIGPSMVWTLKRVDTDEWRLIPQSGGKVLIEEITLSSAGVFDFDNIPQGFNRLLIEGLVRGSASAPIDGTRLFLNNDTTEANYHTQRIGYSNGSSSSIAEVDFPAFGFCPAALSPAASYGYQKLVLEGYATGRLKSVQADSRGYLDNDNARIDLCTVTSAISSAVTRIRIRTDNHPTDGLLGTLRLYGEM